MDEKELLVLDECIELNLANYEKFVQGLVKDGLIQEVGWFNRPHYMMQNMGTVNAVIHEIFCPSDLTKSTHTLPPTDGEDDVRYRTFYHYIMYFRMLFSIVE